jgi:hypothetical protein
MNTLLSFDSALNALKRNFNFTDNNLLKSIFFPGNGLTIVFDAARLNLSIFIWIRVSVYDMHQHADYDSWFAVV